MMEIRKAAAVVAAASILATIPASYARASMEDDKAGYDAKAEEMRKQSNALQQKIESLSEEKRAIDEEADAAIAEHDKFKAALDETTDRMNQNESRLKEVGADYEVKSGKLGKRVRDIYINGQISYLDVLFGAKDVSDFMTRMDLL